MKYTPLVITDPGTFAYTEGQTYYNELLAHAILTHAAAMSDEGYEITWEEADTYDYAALWAKQSFALTALSSALASYDNIPEFSGFYQQYSSQLQELSALEYSKENYSLRSSAITAISAFLSGVKSEEDDSEEEMPVTVWNRQESVILSIIHALSTLAAKESDPSMITYFGALANSIGELKILENTRENYLLRSTEINNALVGALLPKQGQLDVSISEPIEVKPLAISIPEPVQVQRVYPAFPEALWNQQTLALQEQTAFLNKVKENLNTKLEQLPVESTSQSVIGEFVSSLLEDWATGSFTFGLKYLLSWLAGAGGFATAVLGFLCTIGLLSLKDLWDRYTQGVQACDALIAENAEALAISLEDPEDTAPLWEYYRLRETVIVRHQRDIHNLLTEIIALEERTSQSLGEPTSDMTELISAVKDLGMEGYEIEAEDFKIRKLGRTLTTESW